MSREAAGEELGGRREGAREAGGNGAGERGSGEVIMAETGEEGGQNSGCAAQPDEEMMRSEVSGLNSLSQSQGVASTGIVETTPSTATPPQSVAETVVSESVAGQLNGEPPAMMEPHTPLRRQLSDDPQTK